MRQALLDTDGVIEAKVSYDDKRADIEYRPDVVTPKQLVEAVDEIGFKAKLSDKKREAS